MKKGQLIIYTVVLIAKIHKIWSLIVQKRKNSKIISILKGLSPITPSQLSRNIQRNNLKQSYHICKGIVYPAEQIHSFLKPSLSVLSTRLLQGNVQLRNPVQKRFLNKRQPSHFILQDNKDTIKIYQIHRMICDYLTIIKKVQTSSLKKIKKIIQSIIKTSEKPVSLASQLFDSDNIFQIYVPSGRQYSVFAKFTDQNGEICTYKPIIMAEKCEDMLKHFQDIGFTKPLMISAVAFGILIFLGLISFQIWKLYKQYKPLKKQSNSQKLNKIIVKSRICTNCKKNLSCIYNKNCGHMPICKECWKHEPNCSECNRQIYQECQYFVC